MSAAPALYASLARASAPAQREKAADWIALFQMVDARACVGVVGAIASVAAERGVAFGTLRRRYYAWRKGDAEAAALDRRAARPPETPRRAAFLSAYLAYTEDDRNTSVNGWRRMMADFQAGKELPGVGSWREVWRSEHPFEAVPERCPADWIPAGASYPNLQKAAARDPDRLFQLLAARQGRRAAHRALLPVLTTRRGTPVGAVYQFDDVWHNIDVMVPGGKTAQPLEFAGYDLASAFKMASVMKPRLTSADGTRNNLTEQQFRFLLGHVCCRVGFHRDGVRLVLEHGTTAIRSEVARQIATIPHYGALITHAESGVLSEQLHAGLFPGCGGGNFRFKALVESSHNVLHNREASLKGNRGRDAERMHESRDALVRYEEGVYRAVAALDPCAVARIESGLLSWAEYGEAFRRIEDALMDDPDHRLEGWDERTVAEFRLGPDAPWRPADELLDMGEAQRAAVAAYVSAHPDCRRLRYMTRREAWRAGQADLVRVPLFEMPAFLSEKDAVELTVSPDGLVSIRNALYFGRDEMNYRAEARDPDGRVRRFAPGTRLWAKWNPLCPEQIWILDRESGATLGTAPLHERAPVCDRAAILRAMGEQARDLARKVNPARGRHQRAAEERAARMASNAQLLQELAGAPRPPAKAPAAAKRGVRPATLEELAAPAPSLS